MSDVLGKQGLVIGAGVSGLAAAGVLASHFEQVTVLERDGLADDPSHRPGPPQSRQLHGLLSGGLEALCQIFPGFDQDLAAAGAAPIRVAADFREELPGFDPFPRRDFGGVAYAASRPLLEHTVRRRALALRNVAIRDRCRVLELVSSADRRRVTGARCEGGPRDAGDGPGRPHRRRLRARHAHARSARRHRSRAAVRDHRRCQHRLRHGSVRNP